MSKLRKIAITVTCTLLVLLALTTNLGSELDQKGYACGVLWEVPFTARVIHLPYWSWTASSVLWLVSFLTISIFWTLVAAKERGFAMVGRATALRMLLVGVFSGLMLLFGLVGTVMVVKLAEEYGYSFGILGFTMAFAIVGAAGLYAAVFGSPEQPAEQTTLPFDPLPRHPL